MKLSEHIGKRYGRLVVEKLSENRKGYVLCKCDCGNVKEIRATSLVKSKQPTRSCGCIHTEKASEIGKSNIKQNSIEHLNTNMKYNTNFQMLELKEPIKSNTSGHTGVYYRKDRGKWCAYVQVHHKRINLGNYLTFDEAVKARLNGEERYYKPLIERKEEENESL